jgi:PTH1 family peptidyl-tRNA hydrolase
VALKLIVGLGNPGHEYAFTRHNLGFAVVDRLAEAAGVEISRPEALALTATAEVAGTPVVLAKPQTYMNLSGLAVSRLLERYGLPVNDLVVVLDEVNLPLGTLRIRTRGSAGGHNGLKSVIGSLQSDDFVRVRLGIRGERVSGDLADYVLSPFREEELETVADMIGRATEAIEVLLREGPQKAMSRYNQRLTTQ